MIETVQNEIVQKNVTQRIRFLEFGDTDYKQFPAIKDAVERFAPRALDRLYRRIGETSAINGFFSSPQHMRHASEKQLDHWRELFSRPLDSGYYTRAETIGHVHAQIGLQPTWYIGGYAMVLEEMIDRLLNDSLVKRLNGKKVSALLGTLVKTALLDMDVALSAYFRVEEGRRQAVIDQLGSALDQLARGDFTVRLEDLPEAFSKLARDFEAMRTQMNETMERVAESAESIKTGSSEISSASDDLAHRTEQQAASLEETAAAMEDVTGSVRTTAEGARHVNQAVQEAHQDAEEGGRVVRDAVGAMDDIERSSQEIANIISVIDGIAFQTNLLALNAGVEAARAGDAGKGFAVVANEVRALAQRSADAAKDIKQLITLSSQQVEKGVELVGRTGATLDRIVRKVGEITTEVQHISAAATAQANGLQQINGAVSGMDKMTQQNAAMVEEATAAARSLASESAQLASLVSNFRLDGAGVQRKQLVRADRTLSAAPMVRGNLALKQPEDWTDF